MDKLKAYFIDRASKAGKAGTGKAKVRGDKAYYQRISKQGVQARKTKRAKKVKTYYIEVDNILTNYCETWRDAMHKALEWSAQPYRHVVIWDNTGKMYPNWKPVVPDKP